LRKWIIRYWANESGKSPIEKWIHKLTEEQAMLVTKQLRMLEELGNELQLPHSRSLGKGLFELRERRFGYRLYYCFQEDKLIILLVTGDKTSQDRDIKTAYKRLEEL
jgi:putative addiction module killer protein